MRPSSAVVASAPSPRSRRLDHRAAEVLLVGPAVELAPALVDAPVAAAEAVEGLTRARGEAVGHRHHAARRHRPGPHAQRAPAVGAEAHDEPPAAVRRGQDEAHAAAVRRGPHDARRPVDGARAPGAQEVARPERALPLLDPLPADLEGQRRVDRVVGVVLAREGLGVVRDGQRDRAGAAAGAAPRAAPSGRPACPPRGGRARAARRPGRAPSQDDPLARDAHRRRGRGGQAERGRDGGDRRAEGERPHRGTAYPGRPCAGTGRSRRPR